MTRRVIKSKAPDFSEARPYRRALGTSARVAISFYIAHSRPDAGERLVFPR
jgi:hypothetical protein